MTNFTLEELREELDYLTKVRDDLSENLIELEFILDDVEDGWGTFDLENLESDRDSIQDEITDLDYEIKNLKILIGVRTVQQTVLF